MTAREKTIIIVCGAVIVLLMMSRSHFDQHPDEKVNDKPYESMDGDIVSGSPPHRSRWLPKGAAEDYSVIEKRDLMGDSLSKTNSMRMASPAKSTDTTLTKVTDEIPPPPPTQGPKQEMIAFVGVVTVHGREEAVIEKVGTNKTEFVPVGGETFGYRVIAIEPDAVILSKNDQQYRLLLGDNKPDEARQKPLNSTGNLTEHRGKIGQQFTFEVTGRLTGSVWGTDTYTDDSDLGTAAVHAGILRDGQKGIVRVTILEGQERYEGSTRNGVTSSSFAAFGGSYRLGS